MQWCCSVILLENPEGDCSDTIKEIKKITFTMRITLTMRAIETHSTIVNIENK